MSLVRRQAAAAKYRPKQIRLLLVAEAPPCATERYFYFENMAEHDSLFRHVWEGLKGHKPDRARKAEQLAALRDEGVYLIDVHEESISGPKRRDLLPCVPGLIERCRALGPQRIILIKVGVYDVAFEALNGAGLPVVNERMPFPDNGHQTKFLVAFRRAIAAE